MSNLTYSSNEVRLMQYAEKLFVPRANAVDVVYTADRTRVVWMSFASSG